jgi:hypothetical protein
VATIDLRHVDDEHFAVRFGTENSEIDVYTLTQTLSGFADALREINRIINPEFELEVIIEATGEGSFIAKLRTRKFAKKVMIFTAINIVLPLLLWYVTETLKGHAKPTYKIVGDEFILETEGEVLIIPKTIFEQKKKIDGNPRVALGVRKAIVAVKQDLQVHSVGLIPNPETPQPASLDIPRELFDQIIFELDRDTSQSSSELILQQEVPSGFRDNTQRAELTILKAVLKRSPRKWQFVLNGLDISAPITDSTFFDRLQLREISISQGDSLDADLKTYQSFDDESGVWRTTGHQVTKVYGIIPGTKPATLDLNWDALDSD